MDNVTLEDGVEIPVEELTPQQDYMRQQILALQAREKELLFELDPVRVALNAFRNTLAEDLKKQKEEDTSKPEKE